MPRFFFDTNDDPGFWDDEGTELPDLDAARRAAVRFAGELLKDGRCLGFGETLQLTASDSSDAVLFTIDVKLTLHHAALTAPGHEGAHRRPRQGRQPPETVTHSN